MKFLPLVLKNLLRKKTRSGLTVGSILLPFFVICLLGTFVAMLDADPSQGPRDVPPRGAAQGVDHERPARPRTSRRSASSPA